MTQSLPCSIPFYILLVYTFQERKHQQDLQLLKERLDRVDSNQQQQLEELQEIAHSTFRGTFPDLDEKIGDTLSDKGNENKLEESTEKADVEKSSWWLYKVVMINVNLLWDFLLNVHQKYLFKRVVISDGFECFCVLRPFFHFNVLLLSVTVYFWLLGTARSLPMHTWAR